MSKDERAWLEEMYWKFIFKNKKNPHPSTLSIEDLRGLIEKYLEGYRTV